MNEQRRTEYFPLVQNGGAIRKEEEKHVETHKDKGKTEQKLNKKTV